MIRRTKVWLAVAVVFGLGNIAGAVMAAIAREPMHTLTHVVLALLGVYVAGALVVAMREPVAVPTIDVGEIMSDRMAHLERSLEGLASGVERMTEGERSVSKLFAERARTERRPTDDL